MENENNEINVDDQIKKCLKSYLMGKKYMDTDKDKSFEYSLYPGRVLVFISQSSNT